MSKQEGKKIGIEFTQALVGDVNGNLLAFTITGQEYKYVNGPLINGDYKIEKIEPHPTRENSILLTMKALKDFNKVEGLLTINYDATKGNLSGQGGAIDSFVTSFSPVDLVQVPNPGIVETITGAPTIAINYLEVTCHKGYAAETITAAPAEITVAFLSTEEINP